MFLVTWWLRILLCFWYWNGVFAGRYVSHCICIFHRAHVVIQVLRVPESTPPLPKDVKDMIDRRIEIINNKEELVSVLNPVPLVDVLLLPGCKNWVNLSLCERWNALWLGNGWVMRNLQGCVAVQEICCCGIAKWVEGFSNLSAPHVLSWMFWNP